MSGLSPARRGGGKENKNLRKQNSARRSVYTSERGDRFARPPLRRGTCRTSLGCRFRRRGASLTASPCVLAACGGLWFFSDSGGGGGGTFC